MRLRRIFSFPALALASSALISAAVAEAAQEWNQLRGVLAADFNHDGSRVIARSRTGEIGIWNVEEGGPVAGELAADARSTCYEMSDDHRFVVIAFESGSRVFDTSTAAAVSPMLDAQLRDQLRTRALFSPDNSTVIIFEEKQTSVWDPRSGERIAAIAAAEGPHEEAPPSAIFTGDGAHCFLMQRDGTVTRYDTRTWKPVGKPMRHPRFDTAYEFGFSASADGKWIATFDDAGENGPKGQLQVWDAVTSKPVGRPLIEVNGFSARFLADPARVLVEPARGDATMRELPSMKTLYTIKAHDDVEGPQLAVSPNRDWIFAWGADRTLLVLDSATGTTKATYPQKAAISGVLVAADSGACFVSYDNSTFTTEGFHDNYIMRLSVPELNVVGKFRSLDYLSDTLLSPDGRRLLVREGGDENERLLIFNASNLSPVGASAEE